MVTMTKQQEDEFVRNHFRRMTDAQRKKEKEHYEFLLANERGEIAPKKNFRTGKMFVPTKMPWMVPAWTSGLQILNEIIHEINDDW